MEKDSLLSGDVFELSNSFLGFFLAPSGQINCGVMLEQGLPVESCQMTIHKHAGERLALTVYLPTPTLPPAL
jgi:hypothetical protein